MKTPKTITRCLIAFGTSLVAFATYAQMAIGTNFWVTGWGKGPGEYFKTGQSWGTIGSGTNWKTANPWRDDFVNEIKMYNTLRFMDWQRTNNNNDVNWTERTSPTSDHFNNGGEVALEWCVNLANRIDKNVWFCVPHKASDDYIRKLATFLRDNLEVDRKIFIEYSNETWNSVFQQNGYCMTQGKNGGYPGLNDNYKGENYSMHRSLRVFGIFEEVFGSSNVGRWARVRRVVSCGGNLDWVDKALRDIYKSTTYNPNNRKIDFLAVAPYVGGGIDGAASDVATKFRAETDKVYTNRVLVVEKSKNAYAIPAMAAYEGGHHINTNADKWSANSKIYAEYRYMLDKFKPKFAHFVHYTHVGDWNGTNAWGAKRFTGQSDAEAHKYRALKDWAAANPAREAADEDAESFGKIEDTGLLIYPNPTAGLLNIEVNGQEAAIKVYNAQGSIVASAVTVEGIAKVNISGSGIYFVEVATETDRTVKKVVVE